MGRPNGGINRGVTQAWTQRAPSILGGPETQEENKSVKVVAGTFQHPNHQVEGWVTVEESASDSEVIIRGEQPWLFALKD